MAALMDETAKTFGGINIFHANFADQNIIFDDNNIIDVSDAVLDRTLDINLKGMARATRHALPRLLARGGGAMIYSSSAAATMGDIERPCYAMAKAGIGALVRQVANRWGREGIRANAILPGYIMTPAVLETLPETMAQDMQRQTPAIRLGRSEDIAAMVATLSSADGEWINGQMISVDGVWRCANLPIRKAAASQWSAALHKASRLACLNDRRARTCALP
ncbi:MAG TPA: SDR family oxidoreductase [Sphingobium sp.]|nr:SDR family oxidoreductase [Sphingobium sp.]